MSNLTIEQQRAVSIVVSAVMDAVKVAGDRGAPGGIIYSALMASGVTFNQYTSLMGAMVRAGKLRRSGDLYFVVAS